MLVPATYGKEEDIVRHLRRLDSVISTMNWKTISPVESRIKNHLNHLFSNYINVNTMTDKEYIEFMNLIHNHRISNHVKNMIIARLLFDLDELNTHRSEQLKTDIMEAHVLKLIK